MDKHRGKRLHRQSMRIAVCLAAALFVLAAGSSAWAQAAYRLTLFNPGSDGSIDGIDINNAGHVMLSLAGHGAVWDGASVIELGQGVPCAINDAGQVAGYSRNSQGLDRATVWSSSDVPAFISAEVSPPLLASAAFDLNDRGQVVGMRVIPGNHRATLWESGGYVDLGLGQAWGINNSGQTVGFSLQSMVEPSRAALWDANGLTLLAGPDSRAHDINDRGQIIGSSGSQAQLWEGGRSVGLGTLGGSLSFASAINNAGQITGYFLSSDGLHAALWSDTLGVDLNNLLRPQNVAEGWVLRTASGINDNGWIVGTALNRFDCADGECAQYGFVLSLSNLPDRVLDITAAVPEPSTYALMLAGLGAVGLWAQRRRPAGAATPPI